MDRHRDVASAGALAALVGGLTLALVALGSARPTPEAAGSASFTASHVTVTVRVLGAGNQRTVEVVFTPDAPDLHLYGPDLPRSGVDGAGRPTLLEVTGGGWRQTDSAVRSVEPTPFATELPGFSAAFSLLPPGPVVVRVPISVQAGADASVAVVAVTYMACSTAGRCFAPVEAQPISVAVPAS